VSGDWKNAHANEATDFAKHPFIDEVLTEFATNMGFERKGLPEYGLQKIVHYVAQVVLARAKGFEPELLIMTAEEGNEHQRKLMRMFLEAGKPVIVTDGNFVATVDPKEDRP